MQAKDIRITETERKVWVEDGTLQEKILEKSGLFVNQFHPGDASRYWTAYEGGYQADLQALEVLYIQEGHRFETVPVTFYLKDQDNISVTINAEVEVSSTNQEQETEEVQHSAPCGKSSARSYSLTFGALLPMRKLSFTLKEF